MAWDYFAVINHLNHWTLSPQTTSVSHLNRFHSSGTGDYYHLGCKLHTVWKSAIWNTLKLNIKHKTCTTLVGIVEQDLWYRAPWGWSRHPPPQQVAIFTYPVKNVKKNQMNLVIRFWGLNWAGALSSWPTGQTIQPWGENRVPSLAFCFCK